MKFNNADIKYIENLYENIFGKIGDNSKELITFVKDENPHPLRIKVEDDILEFQQEILEQSTYANNAGMTQPMVYKLSKLTELDTFITNYIDNNYNGNRREKYK